MHTRFIARKGLRLGLSAITRAAIPILAIAVSATSVQADTLFLRKGFAAGENGAVGGSKRLWTNGEGQGAFQRGVFAADGQGNGVATKGGCAEGQTVNGCRGRAASWNSDGSFTGQAGTEVTGENGFIDGQRSITRDSNGNLTAGRSLDASGEDGAYSGAASFDDGTYNRDGTYSGDDGQTATVDGNWVLGSGGSRSLTCVDASGATVDCR